MFSPHSLPPCPRKATYCRKGMIDLRWRKGNKQKRGEAEIQDANTKKHTKLREQSLSLDFLKKTLLSKLKTLLSKHLWVKFSKNEDCLWSVVSREWWKGFPCYWLPGSFASSIGISLFCLSGSAAHFLISLDLSFMSDRARMPPA